MNKSIAAKNKALPGNGLPTEVASLMVPLSGRPLLVPNLAVAEIVPFSAPTRVNGKPSWYIGRLAWRGLTVPLVSIVGMRGEGDALPSDPRIAVLSGVHGQLPFYAVVAWGIPRLVRVRSQDVEPTEGMYTAIDDAFVAVGGELAIIPNLARIEAMIVDADAEA